MSVNSCSSGTTSAIPGNIDVAMISERISPLPRKSSRARAYAAKMPRIRVSSVVVPATIRLLSSARPNPFPGENAASRFSSDGGAGRSELENWSDGRRSAETTIQ